jgi:FAD/FMN-containing dehydrogenase
MSNQSQAHDGIAGRVNPRKMPVMILAVAVLLGGVGGFARASGAAYAGWLIGLALALLALVLAGEIGRYVFDRWMFGGRPYNHAPAFDAAPGKWSFSNWAGNHHFTPKDTEAPATLEELLAVVERFGRAGRRIKAIGSLHSWSSCAVTDDVCVRMERFDRVLSHDAEARTITAQAGIKLHALYEEMDKRGLAIASMPNVDTIQLGGAISNATHGTNFTRGTMSSYVTELQIVVFQAPSGGGDAAAGKAVLLTLRRDDPDPENRAWFEAAVASFGSIGIIYSLTLQCEPSFACFVGEHSFPFSHLDGRIAEVARKHYSVSLVVATSNGVVRAKVQVPIARDLVKVEDTCLLNEGDLRVFKVLLWASSPTATTWRPLRKRLSRVLYDMSVERAVPAAEERRRRGGLLSWKHAEMLSRVFAITASSPWINLEFAVPVERADEAARKLLDVMKGHSVLTIFVMRPVGADRVGFLSPTKGRPTVFFDIPYHSQLLATGVYAEIEKILLACEGRCSWSRLFQAPPAEVIKQYPEYPEFVRAKRALDPRNVFSNRFSDAILFQDAQAPAPEGTDALGHAMKIPREGRAPARRSAAAEDGAE